MSGLSEGCLMHSTKTITMDKFAPNDSYVYNATVGQSGCLTFRIEMPWVKENADLFDDPYIEKRQDFTTPFQAYCLPREDDLFETNWFQINDAPPCVFENGIAVQEITITPVEGIKPTAYQINIGRNIHYRQMGACDMMYKIRRRHTYAVVVVCVKGAAECTCRR